MSFIFNFPNLLLLNLKIFLSEVELLLQLGEVFLERAAVRRSGQRIGPRRPALGLE